MKYLINHKNSDISLIMLHGTGGDERDLISVASFIDDNANYIGIAGDVLENGMRRYFKRYPNGSFDEDDLKDQTEKLYQQIQEIVTKYQLNPNRVVVMGYSNGANIIQSMLKTYDNPFMAAFLFHPSEVMRQNPFKHQKQSSIFVAMADNDPYTNSQANQRIIQSLKESGAKLEVVKSSQGHQLTTSSLNQAKSFYQSLFLK